MGRPRRDSYAGACHHVSVRCNNREFQFAEDALFTRLRDTLAEARRTHRFRLLDYCFMTNHFHLLLQVPREDTLSKAMHTIDTRFSRWFNAKHSRCGHLWEGRFRSTIIEAESYLLHALAYVDLNPVRAGMVDEPWAWPWSGCAHPATWSANDLLDEDPLYQSLGTTAAERKGAYRRMLAERMAAAPLAARPELSEGLFIGSPRFIEEMTQRFAPHLCTKRTRLAPIAPGILSLGLAARGGHRTSTARPGGQRPESTLKVTPP